MYTYSNAHAHTQTWIFYVQFLGNRIIVGVIPNDFWSSTIWVIQIQVPFTGIKNPKNPGIQPTQMTWKKFSKSSFTIPLIYFMMGLILLILFPSYIFTLMEGSFSFCEFCIWTYDIQIGNFVMQFIIHWFLYPQLGLVILFQEMIRRFI